MSLQDWSYIANIIMAIANIVMAFAAIFAAREYVLLRRHQDKPELLIDDLNFYAEDDLDSPATLMTKWTNKNHNDDKSPYGFNLDVLNVGKGAAKDIKINWKINVKECIDTISPYVRNIDNNIAIIIGPIPIPGGEQIRSQAISVYINGKATVSFAFEENTEEKYALLPTSTEINRSMKIRIPHCFTILLGIYYKAVFHGTAFGASAQGKKLIVPRLGMSISYKDIHGKQYEKLFDINCSLNSISGKKEDKFQKSTIFIDGIFKFVEKQHK